MLPRAILYIVVFLICVVVLAKVRSRAVRQSVLLIASYGLFGSWQPWFAAVLLLSTIFNFFVGKWLRRTLSARILFVGIALNLLLLSAFKYLPEVAASTNIGRSGSFAHVALPLGISFWTFQAMSYLFDLYRGEELDPSFTEFALFMAFFPVLISGPICRMPQMLPQFRSEATTTWSDIAAGLRRIAIGILMMQFGKLLGQGILSGGGIDSGFDRLARWSGPDTCLLAFGFGLQLFFDFAGYSHMAIGVARALGITVPENFARPFESTSISVFWTRWHMSLSFWIRDYVFLPLAMLRRELWWRNFVLFISMLLFGLWHRASLLFILWGCYHGVLLVLHRQLQELQRRFDWTPPSALWASFSWVATLGVVSLGWIFFRAKSVWQAKQMLLAVLTPSSYGSHFVSGSLYLLVAALALGYAIVLSVSSMLESYVVERQGAAEHTSSGVLGAMVRSQWYWLPPLYTVALVLVSFMTLSGATSTAQLMYRQF